MCHLFCGFAGGRSPAPGLGPPWPAAACRAPERAGRRLSDGDGPRAEDGILAPRRPQRLHLLGRRGHPSARKTVARRRADRRARERPFLERRIALTGGWPDTANGWAACSASGPGLAHDLHVADQAGCPDLGSNLHPAITHERPPRIDTRLSAESGGYWSRSAGSTALLMASSPASRGARDLRVHGTPRPPGGRWLRKGEDSGPVVRPGLGCAESRRTGWRDLDVKVLGLPPRLLFCPDRPAAGTPGANRRMQDKPTRGVGPNLARLSPAVA
jgi:hypothetical protein